MRHLIAATMFIIALADNVQAHFVWLERDGEGVARAYFGE
jgi:uncharacterized GH25 family protein